MVRPIELEQASLRARMQVKSPEGRCLAPLAECRKISLNGLRATAAKGIVPGTSVVVSLRLPNGFVFETRGRVTGCCTTLHLAPFGTTQGLEDDAIFEIDFDERDPDQMWPIAALLLEQQAPVRQWSRRKNAPQQGRRILLTAPDRA